MDCAATDPPLLPRCGADCEPLADGGCADTCAAARCAANATCTARFLGGDLPVTRRACICEPPYTGPTCELDPCDEAGETCSGRGRCVGVGDVGTRCECGVGYSGAHCEIDCSSACTGGGGVYPFGCNPAVASAVHFCGPSGGCQYADSITQGHTGWCAYKVADACASTVCAAPDDCHLGGVCTGGACGPPTAMPDGTPCNAAPWGRCMGGVCQTAAAACNVPPSPPPQLPPNSQGPTSYGTPDGDSSLGLVAVASGAMLVVLLVVGASVHRARSTLRRSRIIDTAALSKQVGTPEALGSLPLPPAPSSQFEQAYLFFTVNAPTSDLS